MLLLNISAITPAQRVVLARLKTAAAAAALSNPVINADMASPPTITQSASHDATLSVIATAASNLSQFRVSPGHQYIRTADQGLRVATANVTTNSGGNMASVPDETPTLVNLGEEMLAPYVTFVTSSQFVEFQLPGSGTTIPYRFIVNDQFVARDGLLVSNSFVKLDFGSTGLRTIILEMQTASSALIQVAVSAGQTITAPTDQLVYGASSGDSYCEGINGIPQSTGGVFYVMDSISSTFAKQVGINAYRNTCVGATGYWNEGGGSPGSRGNINKQMPFWATDYTYDTIWFMAGYNDEQQTTDANLIALALADWQLARSTNPNALIVVFGIWGGSKGPGATIPSEVALRKQFFAWNDPFSVFIPVSTDNTATGTWLFGVGNNGTGEQNAATYISSDNTHPNRNGAIYLGGRCAAAYVAAMNMLK